MTPTLATLCVLFSTAAAVFWTALLLRLRRARTAVRFATARKGRHSRLLDLLEPALLDLIDGDLLPDAGPGGLRDLPVRFREPHDSADNAFDLLAAVGRDAGSKSPKELIELAKRLFQLQHALGDVGGSLDACVRAVADRLESTVYLGTTVERVEVPRAGTPYDPRTMWALTSGNRVSRPLGLTLIGPSGRVLDKAKVLCR